MSKNLGNCYRLVDCDLDIKRNQEINCCFVFYWPITLLNSLGGRPQNVSFWPRPSPPLSCDHSTNPITYWWGKIFAIHYIVWSFQMIYFWSLISEGNSWESSCFLKSSRCIWFQYYWSLGRNIRVQQINKYIIFKTSFELNDYVKGCEYTLICVSTRKLSESTKKWKWRRWRT